MTRIPAWLLAVLALVLGAAVSGCTQGTGIPEGTAFRDPGGGLGFGERALPPGARIGLLYQAFWNSSHRPLTITKVTITGRGIGTVVRLAEVKIAPITYLPGTYYTNDPPTYHFLHPSPLGPVGCDVQPLYPVHGYVVVPKTRRFSVIGGLRLWVVMQMLRPGKYSNLGDTVYYTQDGRRYRNFIPFGFMGSVARHAAWPSAYPDEKGCLYKTHPLNPGYG